MGRSYTKEPVDPTVLDRIMTNATRAPSAGFSQGWGFLVLDTDDDVRRYWSATAEAIEDPDAWLRGMMRAPVVVVPCSSKAAYLRRYAEPDKGWTDMDEARWPVPFWHMDAAMASLLILQTAVDAGLGAASSASRHSGWRRSARSSRSPMPSTRWGRSPWAIPPLNGDLRIAQPAAPQGPGGGRPPRQLGRRRGRSGLTYPQTTESRPTAPPRRGPRRLASETSAATV